MEPPPAANSVLVVDDDPVLGGLISRGLRGVGYNVAEAADGNKAISALETATYDAVVIDIIMPIAKGWRPSSKSAPDGRRSRSSPCPAGGAWTPTCS